MEGGRQFDYLIVGQGLAGTCLAIHLEKKYNKSVYVVDRDCGQNCSRVAAGTFNPLVFRTFSPTWRSPELIPYLNEFYGKVGKGSGDELLTARPVFKRLKSGDQRRLWIEKSSVMPSSQFMAGGIIDDIEGVKGEFGFGAVKQSGNLNMIVFLDNYRLKLVLDDRLLTEEFDYNSLKINKDGLEYKGVSAKKLVFCQGYENSSNPYFNDLPFRPTKGEVLVVRIPGWRPGGIVHNKINIIPMGNDLYWVGSSFDWNDLSLEKTDKARKNLTEQVKESLSVEFEVVEHRVGIRPTVRDRRPVLGRHPKLQNIYVFNGLGTRGVMLAPYFANEMASFLEENKEIDREADMNRFI